MKKMKIFLTLSIMLLLSNNLNAQGILASTNDNLALPRTQAPGCGVITGVIPNSVVNTGYDAFQNTPLQLGQVMVWDGPNGAFSWDFNGNRGSIACNAFPIGFQCMSDMDIVIHNVSGAVPNRVYAMVVGVITQAPNIGSIGWVRFDNTGTTFVAGPTGVLGHNNTCLNPNIDVNNRGAIGICWSESSEYTVNYTITPGFIPGGTGPYTATIRRSDIYAAYGWMDGTSPFNNLFPIRGDNDNAGDKINAHIPPSDFLSERNEFPDIAVQDILGTQRSPGINKIPVFITWSRTYWDMINFNRNSDVQVREIDISNSSQVTLINSSTNNPRGYSGKPRIAARPLDFTSSPIIDNYDYQIVFSAFDDNCPATDGYRILNWGRHNSGSTNVFTNPTLINGTSPTIVTSLFTPALGTFTGGTNMNPVVTYQNPTSSSGNIGNYLVAWEHSRISSVGLTDDATRNVIATTMNNLSLATLPNPVTAVSYVNRRCSTGVPAVTQLVGNQSIPSIAGRHTLTNGYCFWDNNNYIAYKTSVVSPGVTSPGGSLRQLNEVDTSNPTDLILSPNPTKSLIDVKLTNKNNIEKIEIYSSNGQLVFEKEAIKNNSDLVDVSKLSNGIYVISVKTMSDEIINKEFIKE
jgi:hypothetical protein